MTNAEILILMGTLIFAVAVIGGIVYKETMRAKVRQLSKEAPELTPDEFFKLRNMKDGRKHYSTNHEFSGVYVIHNKTKDMFYVGQAKKIFKRVNDHFTGHGNGDVYADYKNGDTFTIRMTNIENSHCKTLNELERVMIDAYDANKKGYNKTRGNKG